MAEKYTEMFSQLFAAVLKIPQLVRNFNSPQIEKPFNLRAIPFQTLSQNLENSNSRSIDDAFN
jgi:hypothetical protein